MDQCPPLYADRVGSKNLNHGGIEPTRRRGSRHGGNRPRCRKNVDCLQEQRLNGEKIAGQELLPVMRHQMAPVGRSTAFGSGWNAMAFQDVGDGFFTCLYVQFEQFPWIFRYLQSPFSRANRTTRCSVSRWVRGRPPVFVGCRVHLRRTSSRCQRNTVSGWTIRIASRYCLREPCSRQAQRLVQLAFSHDLLRAQHQNSQIFFLVG